MDRIDERSDYLELIRENIEYDCFDKREQEKVDELVEIMVDVVCSAKKTLWVNSEEMPKEAVVTITIEYSNNDNSRRKCFTLRGIFVERFGDKFENGFSRAGTADKINLQNR